MNRRSSRAKILARAVLLACLACLAGPTFAAGGRLLASGGASQVEGAAGGGLVPWAVLAGYGTRDENGGTAFASRLHTDDYRLEAFGLAWTFRNRLELSLARQRLDIGVLQRQLDLPWAALGQDVIGAKLRLGGDLLYTPWPQFSLGVQYKRSHDDALPLAIGARSGDGWDVYLSASKLFLDMAGQQVLFGLTLRSTRANQFGLLGHGGDLGRGRDLVWEGVAALLLDPSWVVGAEYRQKPDNLAFAAEEGARDLFLAWFPNKRVAVVAGWVDLGDVATLGQQQGPYLSIQVSH
ncbi:DUF3034 family protein [Arenimonas fontis]|uniref:DUF3034 family protein n=1 Tax=Arenimonas fontis TaxID=2608255 RepID=A0A5B2ZGK3_9GAMM|nr:DUF3034 family protein [Arenimonas fontis]KAA2286201.1 DUF3034 family protein [Arenimonas fontis]